MAKTIILSLLIFFSGFAFADQLKTTVVNANKSENRTLKTAKDKDFLEIGDSAKKTENTKEGAKALMRLLSVMHALR